MLNESEKKMIDDAFAGHSRIQLSNSKSWLMQNPETQGYWFRVTWCPGSLLLSGDVGEILLTHYHAMPTWEEAVEWVNNACHGYLMQKSNKEREFDEEETVKQIILMANEYLNEYDDDCYWSKLSKITRIDIKDKDKICEEIKVGYFESPQNVYEYMDSDADWTGSFSYDIETHFQYEALQLWARTVLKDIDHE